MKVIILGGCGIVGSSVARDLIKSKQIKEVILADIKADSTKLHDSVKNSDKASWKSVNVTNFQELVNVMKGSNVVVNTVGPYYKYGIHIMKAALEAGINYVDVCDDYDVTRVAFDLDEAAIEAGVTICHGFGGAPGTTNLVAKFAADKLDKVDEIEILWAAGVNDPIGPGALLHAMHMFSGNVPQYIDGQWVDVPAGSGAEEVEFLEPTGKAEVFYVGHPEPLTLPRHIKGVKRVVNKGGLLPSFVSRMFMQFSAHDFFGTTPVIMNGLSIQPRDYLASLLKQAPGFLKQVEPYTTSPSNIVVKGWEADKRVTYTYRFDGHQAPGTAISASICVQMLCRGDIKKKGVLAPEGCFDDPKIFFTEFARKGFELTETKTSTMDIKF